MTYFKVDAQTSRMSVCDELDKFQPFSAVGGKLTGTVVTLYEVGLGERLRRGLAPAPGASGMQLVGMTEDVADSEALTAPGKVQDRYKKLLQGSGWPGRALPDRHRPAKY